MPSQINKEKIKQELASMLSRIKTKEDPHLLNEYRALFKREISLFRRSWVTAYLLMLFDQGAPGRNRPRKAAGERSGDSQRFPLSEAESRRLFISVGRNRRVFPREILGLINAKTAVAREDIGSIRILDNYSFVQVRDTAAEQIIEALNGYTFRGRSLIVNYAKFRKDGAVSGEAGDFETIEEDSPDAGNLEQIQDQPDKEDI
jgi:RNA recognition motif-containing protein